MNSVFDLGYELVCEASNTNKKKEKFITIKVESKEGKDLMTKVFKKDSSIHKGVIIADASTKKPFFMFGVKNENKRVLYHVPQIPKHIKNAVNKIFDKSKSLPVSKGFNMSAFMVEMQRNNEIAIQHHNDMTHQSMMMTPGMM